MALLGPRTISDFSPQCVAERTLELTTERLIKFLSSVSDILALAGFSVLFVVEAGLATAWHRTLRLPMSATQSAPKRRLHSS